MDVQRIILAVIFSFSSLMLWQSWQKFNIPASTAEVVVHQTEPGKSSIQQAEVIRQENLLQQGSVVSIQTDTLQAQINTLGGDVQQIALLNYHDLQHKNVPLMLLQDTATNKFVAQSGLLGNQLPTHKSLFQAKAKNYVLMKGQTELVVPLYWDDAATGIQVEKDYVFYPDSYRIDVRWTVHAPHPLTEPIEAYFQFVRDGKAPIGESKVVHTFTGPAFYTQASKFKKVSFESLNKHEQQIPPAANNGWVAIVQHHFVSAWLPKNGEHREFYAKALGNGLYKAGVLLSGNKISSNTVWQMDVPLYVGPQIQKTLAGLAPGLTYVVDYGWLTPIAVPLFWVLQKTEEITGNWGWAIIILTILIKLAFFPLSAKSYRSMAQMKQLTPKLQQLKTVYGDDREKLHHAMMELYKTEKVNPLGGCLPTVVQIPVFIALYWTLVGSVEMRQAPFIGWIHDLSAPDPYYVLPILMGLTMLLQTRLNPAPPDPMQAKVMMVMPVAFTVFFLFFPSGLVLYWVVSNIMSMSQQWVITRQMGKKTVRG